MQSESQWAEAIDRHRASLREFIDAARGVPDGSWDSPLASGKWSPGQVAEHLRLAYLAVGRELDGGVGLKLRTSWWLRLLLRARFLPGILRRGEIPAGAPAPREARPGPGPFPRDAVLGGLEAAAATAETTLSARRSKPGVTVTHHVFGPLNPDQIIRFLAVHNHHHTSQLQIGSLVTTP